MRRIYLDRLLASLGSIGASRLLAALGVTGLVAAMLFAIMFNVGNEEKSLLYSGLSAKDAAAVTETLDTAKIKYEVSPDGSSVFVPRSKIAEARMDLASKGLPGKGSLGYELFDKQDALGATSFVQNINKLRALEGEIARSIDSLDTVQNTRVHLNIPEKSLFSENKEQPTASIIVGLERGSLADRHVGAIRSLVAAAVPNLSPDKVTITDERGELLASAQVGDEAASGAMDDKKAQYEERMRQKIQGMLEATLGPGAARVNVTAEMDFAQIAQTEETFDPDKVAPRSTRSIEETGSDSAADNAVTQGQNVPDGAAPAAAGGNTSATSRTDETVNYEISKSTKTQTTAPGTVTKLSVAVAVDGARTPAAKAGVEPKYAPRTAEEMAQITALVRRAAGISDERGDTIEVTNIKFARAALDIGSKAPSKFSFDKDDIFMAVRLLALLLIAIALIFFVARPLVKGIFADGVGNGGGMKMALPGGGGSVSLPQGASIDMLPSNDTGEVGTVDIARIQGAVNANAMKQVSEVVGDNPEQTVSVIRGWLQERRA